jgi:hypothetical protein
MSFDRLVDSRENDVVFRDVDNDAATREIGHNFVFAILAGGCSRQDKESEGAAGGEFE